MIHKNITVLPTKILYHIINCLSSNVSIKLNQCFYISCVLHAALLKPNLILFTKRNGLVKLNCVIYEPHHQNTCTCICTSHTNRICNYLET